MVHRLRRGRGPISAGLAMAAGLLLAGCQQGLVPGNAYDKPLYSFSGVVRPEGTIPTSAATAGDAGDAMVATNPIMGLLWTDPLQRMQDLPQPARGISSTVSVADNGFQVDIFGPPPPEAMVEIPVPGGSSMRLAVAEIVIIDDQNRDGTFEVSGADATIGGDDQYLAGANSVLVYLDRTYASLPAGNLLAVSGDQGYQLVFYVCDHQAIADVQATNPAGGVIAYTQPSKAFPEVRSCARTHSP